MTARASLSDALGQTAKLSGAQEYRGSGAFRMAAEEVVSRIQRSDNVATKELDESSV
jgi:hypothetical protein